jgi:hypothetical protein
MSYSGPKQLKLLNYTIDVTVDKLPEEHIYAMWSPWLQKIKVSDKKMSPLVERQTIIHELVHAIRSTNLGTRSLTEAQVEQFALGFLSIIRDNKEFIKWVQK